MSDASHDQPNGFGSQASISERILACLGLIVFGAIVGIVAVLSEKSGTAITLLGLLFAMLGGSLVALFANSKLTERIRCHLGIAVGLISLGILIGIFAGFRLKATENFKPPAPAGGDKREPIIKINAGHQEQLKGLAQAAKSVLETLPQDDPNRESFDHLLVFLDYLETSDSKLENLEALAKMDAKYDKDGFSSKLKQFRAGLKEANVDK